MCKHVCVLECVKMTRENILLDCRLIDGSLDGETARLLDGLGQFFVHFLVRRVRRQVQSIETGVRLGQVLDWRVDQVDGEQSRTRGPRRTWQKDKRTNESNGNRTKNWNEGDINQSIVNDKRRTAGNPYLGEL